jgi:hypothetical protein
VLSSSALCASDLIFQLPPSFLCVCNVRYSLCSAGSSSALCASDLILHLPPSFLSGRRARCVPLHLILHLPPSFLWGHRRARLCLMNVMHNVWCLNTREGVCRYVISFHFWMFVEPTLHRSGFSTFRPVLYDDPLPSPKEICIALFLMK